MSRVFCGSLLVCLVMCFAGCGGEKSSVDEAYKSSAPVDSSDGPSGVGGDGATVPAPPPIEP